MKTAASLKEKIHQSHLIIDRAYRKYGSNMALAWTGGKDSTVLLHMAYTLYAASVPFPVFFNDSTMEFEEIYSFIEEISSKWKLNLITVKHLPQDLKLFHSTSKDKQLELSRIMKINAINKAMGIHCWSAIMAAIRWDEHPARSKEKIFSPRSDHMRVHPLLHFTESDIWKYIKEFKVPYVSLYAQGYRSLGEKPFTQKSKKGDGERSGREPAKEKLMETIRKLGYW